MNCANDPPLPLLITELYLAATHQTLEFCFTKMSWFVNKLVLKVPDQISFIIDRPCLQTFKIQNELYNVNACISSCVKWKIYEKWLFIHCWCTYFNTATVKWIWKVDSPYQMILSDSLGAYCKTAYMKCFWSRIPWL